METRELLEQLIVKEMKGLCSSCIHTPNCVYEKITMKRVIQCELFELDVNQQNRYNTPQGLCKTCDNAFACKMPGRNDGVWHCNEFI